MKKYMRSCLSFLNSSERNAWLSVGTLRVYMRKGGRLHKGNLVMSFEIANVEQKGRKGRGDFWRFLEQLEETIRGYPPIAAPKIVFVENVFNERLRFSLQQRGYVLVNDTTPPCVEKQIVP